MRFGLQAWRSRRLNLSHLGWRQLSLKSPRLIHVPAVRPTKKKTVGTCASNGTEQLT
jgi:hypothetical protein